jgi:serine protease AprX
MVAQPMTIGQVRALSTNPAVRSLWSNDRLIYYMHQARVLGGVQRLQSESAFNVRNGGMPVSGSGDFSVLVIDSGIDATHGDLPFGSKVVQNVHPVVAAGTVEGFTPNITIENLQNTDESVGHGTHCAGIVGGTGMRSGGLYTGVAPGAKLIGAGLGAGIAVLNAIGAWEWGIANQFRYNIRVVTNSYGPLGGGEYDPDHPFMIASKIMYERSASILFAAGNDGSAKDTLSPYAQAPWVIGVAAGTKEGTLADFSSREHQKPFACPIRIRAMTMTHRRSPLREPGVHSRVMRRDSQPTSSRSERLQTCRPTARPPIPSSHPG